MSVMDGNDRAYGGLMCCTAKFLSNIKTVVAAPFAPKALFLTFDNQHISNPTKA
eukprot:CAMPEP_0113856344 /NCGR_PEP_ID=MMETSP0372-20130328/9132_1 /TAXON_ID=340204 /ORGANISM="Lankesteria abbotti" /LENGTH=53 /DNA_ID=CAMNT_0000831231 /DNA_START=88 /DNA_END=246 /DNA_ORIENTATION=- /assembly_acc=CAM_ASM_000359